MSADSSLRVEDQGDSFGALVRIPINSRWRRQQHPMPVVVAIIQKQEEEDLSENERVSYLLIRRKSEPYKDYWALIGGKWDFGETLAHAILREVREETSLDVSFDSLVGIVNERLASENGEETKPAQFLLFVCRLSYHSGLATEQQEGAVDWFTPAELERLNEAGEIIPSDFLMLAHFIEAPPVIHHEVDMLASGGVRDSKPGSYIVRFERIV